MGIRIAAGHIIPTPEQFSACDVNNNLTCGADDVTVISCYIEHRDWNLCGGVGGGMVQGKMMTSQGDPVQIAISVPSGQSGQTIRIPVAVVNGQTLAGGSLTFMYDADVMTFIAASPSSQTSDFTLASHVEESGLLRVALASPDALGVDGELFTLEFMLGDGTPSIDAVEYRLNDVYGRDFETSALQQDIDVIVKYIYQIFLPTVTR